MPAGGRRPSPSTTPEPCPLDQATRARRDAIMTEQVAREAPWVLLVLAALIAFFDVISAAVGLTAPLGHYVSDGVQGALFLVAALLFRRHVVPITWAPWLFAGAVAVNVAALGYQHTIDPAGGTLDVILVTTVLFGGMLAMWRPFAVSAVGILGLVVFLLLAHGPAGMAPWIVATLTGIGASAALLLARRRSATELAIAQRTIEGLALRDQATALLNRHGLLTAADLLVSTARRNGLPIFAVFVDVVGLKAVNDQHGHGAGDLVITRCANAVRLASRDCDLVARWGGDEFVVVGSGPEPNRRDYARRVASCLDISGLEGRWPGQVSVGAASSPDPDVLAVIEAADADMYAARPPVTLRAAPAPEGRETATARGPALDAFEEFAAFAAFLVSEARPQAAQESESA